MRPNRIRRLHRARRGGIRQTRTAATVATAARTIRATPSAVPVTTKESEAGLTASLHDPAIIAVWAIRASAEAMATVSAATSIRGLAPAVPGASSRRKLASRKRGPPSRVTAPAYWSQRSPMIVASVTG